MSSKSLELGAIFPSATEAEWRSGVDKAIQGRDFDKVMSKKSYNGFAVKGLYTSNDRVDQKPSATTPTQGWSICAPHWNPDANASNKAIVEDLMGGATAIGLRFQSGHFPGLDVSSMKTIFAGVYPNMINVNLLPGEAFVDVAAAYKAYLSTATDFQGSALDISQLNGTYGCDPLGVLAQSGRLAHSLPNALSEAAEIAVEAVKETPNMRAFTVSTGTYHTAGATESQELGFMLATGLTYLRAMETAGLSLEQAASQIQFTLVADTDIYLTLAKMRAARALWAGLLSHCGVTGSDITMKLTAMGALRMMTMRDPYVNILRSTAACFAAGIGGADEITVLPHDMMLGMSSKSARRIARNLQIVLQEESSLGQVIDPASGSYALESLTDELVQAGWTQFQQIEQAGGLVEGLKLGRVQAAVEDSWQQRCKNLATRRDAITGVSEFPNLFEGDIKDVGPQPAFVETAVEAGIEVAPMAFHRLSEDFEALRTASDQHKEKTGQRPQIFMANLGKIADHTARATFAKNFFEAGGIESLPTKGFDDLTEMATAFKDSGASAAVICGSDGAYDMGASETVAALSDAGAGLIYLAGKRADTEALKALGLTDCIYMGANMLAVLSHALTQFMMTEGDKS